MKDWKTTLAGLVAGLPILIDSLFTAYTAGEFEGKNTLQLSFSIGIILLGWMVNDRKTIKPKTFAEGDDEPKDPSDQGEIISPKPPRP